jgi:hypothetical protein
MAEVDYFMLALLGFFTGLGTTFGGEFAKEVFSSVKAWMKKRAVRRGEKTLE